MQGVGKLKKNPEELGRIVKNHLVYIIMMMVMIFFDNYGDFGPGNDDKDYIIVMATMMVMTFRCVVLSTRPTLLTT